MSRGLVLLVDDDEDLREAVADVLEENDYQVVHVENGEVALQRLQDGLRPGLILLDLMMPVMDGLQFRAEQLKDPALAAIPTVVLSAAGNLQRHSHSLEVSQIIAKPVPPKKLLTIVARYLP